MKPTRVPFPVRMCPRAVPLTADCRSFMAAGVNTLVMTVRNRQRTAVNASRNLRFDLTICLK